MNIRSILFHLGYNFEKVADTNSISRFIERFRENYIPVDLIRVGGESDGGYLLPPILEDVDYCFSPGVDRNVTFETHLYKEFLIKSFLADASIEAPPTNSEHFDFEKKFIGSRNDDLHITLQSWIESKIPKENCNLLLQMDIEGGEYPALTETPQNVLSRFTCMIIEFHSLENIYNKFSLKIIEGIFDKIYSNFYVVHAHPNNCAGIATYKDLQIPRTIEVTFLRKDIARDIRLQEAVALPHPLDKPNSSAHGNIILPPSWWKN